MGKDVLPLCTHWIFSFFSFFFLSIWLRALLICSIDSLGHRHAVLNWQTELRKHTALWEAENQRYWPGQHEHL